MGDEVVACVCISYAIIMFLLSVATPSVMINYKRRLPVEKLFETPDSDLRRAPFQIQQDWE